MARVALGLLASLGVCLGTACGTGSVGIGYSVPTNEPGPDAWRLEARAATGGIVQLGGAVRTRIGDGFDQLALAPEIAVEATPGPIAIGARLGVNLLELDRTSGEWTFAGGSPYLHPLLQFRLGEPVWFFVGATLEYDLGVRDDPNRVYVGAQLGVGFEL